MNPKHELGRAPRRRTNNKFGSAEAVSGLLQFTKLLPEIFASCSLASMLRFTTDEVVSAESFRNILLRSTLGERRPVDDIDCLRGMIKHSNLIVTAWDGQLLVGIARSVTDFHYCCYLSDLAVDVAYQRRGIGKQLIQITREALGPRCKIILLSAPAAVDYYPRLGFERHDQAWVLARSKQVNEKVKPRGSA